MIEEDVARNRILQALPEATGESLPLSDCLGRRAFEDVIATVALPGFDNSAMDGYAVRVFLHHHRIRTLRQRRASKNLDRLTCL